MKQIVALAFALISSSSLAHLEVGTWTGVTDTGVPCAFVAGAQFFEFGTHHPLNERIPVTVDGSDFVVGHPPVVEAGTSTAFFNHDLFQGVLATPNGARALVIEMEHAAGSEGPKAFHLIDHAWKTDVRTKLTCKGLKHKP